MLNRTYRILYKPLLPLLLLSGCAQLSQAPAPIESGTPSRIGGPVRTPAPQASAHPAPAVAEATPLGGVALPRAEAVSPSPQGKTHVVQPGETLYRIAVNNGLRYQDLASWNQLDGYAIKVGQVLRLTPPGSDTATATPAAPVSKPAPAATADGALKSYPKALKLPYSEDNAKALSARSEGKTGGTATSTPATPPAPQTAPAATPAPEKKTASAPATEEPAAGSIHWIWPTQGKVVAGFSDKNKGIDISGRMGQTVTASADGKVVYSGTGLRGYGKLIIIKHDKVFLSAYAHNSQLLVKEGQSVKQGQKIAEMGNTDADQVKLHFEIRQYGKPVDPGKFLGNQP